MINKTTRSALCTLQYLYGLGPEHREVVSIREIAVELGESPSYAAKIARELVKAGILRAERGVNGGVQTARPADQVTLRDLVEACQGEILPDHCQASCAPDMACTYHHAATELRDAIVGVLERWNVAMLMERPFGRRTRSTLPCSMAALGPILNPIRAATPANRGNARA